MTLHETPVRSLTGADVLAAAEALAPELGARSAEIEAARELPADLVGTLADRGCLAVLLPRSHGGAEADLPTALSVFETLARGDASTGWTTMISAGGWAELAALPRDSFDVVVGDGRAPVAGAFNPSAQISRSAGGYRISGRWSHASGCTHARWLWGNAVEEMTPEGPRLRVAVFPAEAAEIEDTWRVSGLCGTGSHHIRVTELEVPAEFTLVPLQGKRCLDLPVVRIPTPALFGLGIAAVAVGTTAGALGDLRALAEQKVPLLAGAPLRADPQFWGELATADTELAAMRALLADVSGAVWDRAVAGTEPSAEEHARVRAAAAWISARAAGTVDRAYACGGGTVIYTDGSLQRRWRDVHALTQHFLVKPATLVAAGAALAGCPVPVPVF